MTRPRAISSFFLAMAWSAGLQAQDEFAHFYPPPSVDGFGCSVSGGRDLDRDGYSDLLISGWKGTGGGESGRVLVLSGRTRQPLALLTSDHDSGRFGWTAKSVHDLDGDGSSDIVVGEPHYGDAEAHRRGRVWVFSGSTGQVLQRIVGATAGARFGYSISGAGDWNRDGKLDLLIGAPGSGDDPGAAAVVSVADGKFLARFEGRKKGERFGESVAGVGDLTDDGHMEVLIGAPGRSAAGGLVEAGAAALFSGRTHAVLHELIGSSAGAKLGTAVAAVGDVDLDGYREWAVGAPGGARGRGMVRVMSGKSGKVKYRCPGENPGDLAGISIAMVGDVNADRISDFLIGAPGADALAKNAGQARLYSGRTGRLLFRFQGQSEGAALGTDVAAAGDLNFDGFDDVLIGSPLERELPGSPVRSSQAGAARVFLGHPMFLVISSPVARVGQGVSITVGETASSRPILLFITSVDGESCSIPVLGTLPSDLLGSRMISGIAPIQTAGHEYSFSAIGVRRDGRTIQSREQSVRFLPALEAAKPLSRIEMPANQRE